VQETARAGVAEVRRDRLGDAKTMKSCVSLAIVIGRELLRTPRWTQLARDATYHVMSRGHNREALFADPDDTRYFLGLLDRYRRRFALRLYHDCLMTNHCGPARPSHGIA
jgi:hypothetical protein